MKNAKRIVTIMAAACLMAPVMSAVAQPSADELMEKYVNAIGGKAALEGVKSRVTKGTFSLPDMGIDATMTNYIKPPKFYSEVNVEAMGMTVTRGYTGDVAWEVNPMTGSRVLEGAEKADIMRQAELDPYSNWKEHFEKVEVKGEEEFGGATVYTVEVTPKEGGDAQTIYFDKESGLIVGTKAMSPEGFSVMTKIGEYKEVDGVKIPHSISNEGGMMNFVITFDVVEQNTEIPDEQFEAPAEIKALQGE